MNKSFWGPLMYLFLNCSWGLVLTLHIHSTSVSHIPVVILTILYIYMSIHTVHTLHWFTICSVHVIVAFIQYMHSNKNEYSLSLVHNTHFWWSLILLRGPCNVWVVCTRTWTYCKVLRGWKCQLNKWNVIHLYLHLHLGVENVKTSASDWLVSLYVVRIWLFWFWSMDLCVSVWLRPRFKTDFWWQTCNKVPQLPP